MGRPRSVYFDDQTDEKLESYARDEGKGPSELAAELIRSAVEKRASEAARPKTCPKCHAGPGVICPTCQEKGTGKCLEWHFTPDRFAELYCVCVNCGWRYDTGEVYRTEILKYLQHRPNTFTFTGSFA